MQSRNWLRGILFPLLLTVLLASCKKDSDPVSPDVQTYPVTATVLNPQGLPQGGATLTMKNPPSADPKFTAITNSLGEATIQAPAGPQVLVAKMGTAFYTEFSVNVQASAAGTNAGTVTLTQNTAVRILVVKASAEQLEDVLRVIGFTTFDSTTIFAMRDSANADSVRFLNFLRQYSLIFTNCHGGSEGSSSYALLSRVYGRYVAGGGKMYGGHYNYYHLQRIWQPYYTTFDNQGTPWTDTLRIVDQNLASFVGYTLAAWDSSLDSRRLSYYDKFSDLPPGSKVYGVIHRTSPEVGVIVENYVATGKYLWTNYHNQDIKDVARLAKLVQYFLLNM